MNTDSETNLGLNLTGCMMSPLSAKKTEEGAKDLTQPVPDGSEQLFADNRILYMQEADPVGSMPMPGSVKGAISSLQEKLMNGNHIFMDKLGERIAFERSGTRLYEALLSKYDGTQDKSGLPPRETLEQFHQEEKAHFQMASKAMQSLGGDPTAVTPSADVCGVAALGWVQAMTDPRTSFKQCLEIILQAELVDNSCWEVLVDLAKATGLSDLAEEFQVPLKEEQVHLMTIKNWVRDLTLVGKVDHSVKH